MRYTGTDMRTELQFVMEALRVQGQFEAKKSPSDILLNAFEEAIKKLFPKATESSIGSGYGDKQLISYSQKLVPTKEVDVVKLTTELNSILAKKGEDGKNMVGKFKILKPKAKQPSPNMTKMTVFTLVSAFLDSE